MSMIAQFVQISPDLLSRARHGPAVVEEIFTDTPSTPQAFMALTDEMRRRLPQLLAGALDTMRPSIREAVAKRLGVATERLRQGEGAEAIATYMRERGHIRMQGDEPPGQPPSGDAGKGAALSLEKNWHAVHYLLCGAAEPGSSLASQVVMGGAELGEDFSGYGPARGFAPEAVAQIAAELSRPELEAEMTARFDPAELARLDIYPHGWTRSDLGPLLQECRRLRKFFADARERGLAVATCIV